MRRIFASLVVGWSLVMGNAAIAGNDLAGTTWRIDRIKGVAAIDSNKARMSVNDNGLVSTTVGCNQMSAIATISGSKLSFGPFVSTRMECEPTLMDVEQKYSLALDRARSFRIDGTLLKFIDETGIELISFSSSN